jgi:O-antigen/teichoic acid export membrane protein
MLRDARQRFVNRDLEACSLAEATYHPHWRQSNQKLPSALRNVLSNWAGFACSAAISLFLSPFVVHHLGNSGYGIWVLIGSLTGYLGLLNLGVRGAVTRYVARFHMEANHQEASAVTSCALVIFIAAGTLAILVSLILAAFVVRAFHIPRDYQSAAHVVVILGGLNIAASLIGGVFGGVVTALHRFDLSNLIELANSLLSAVAIVLVLSAGKGLVALASVNLVFTLAAGVAYAVAALRLYPALNIRFSRCDRAHLKLVFSFSVYGFLMQTSVNLIFYTDSVVIGSFLSAGMVTFFAIAGNLMNYSRALIGGISTTMTPRASALEASGAPGAVQKVLLKAVRLATLVILPICITFLLRGNSFIRLWMGKQYAGQSGRVLQILALALIFIASKQVTISTMLGVGKHKPLALVLLGEALCNLALSVALVRRFGIFGVAWGTTVPSLLVSLLFLPRYVRHTLDIPVRRYIAEAWLQPAFCVMPFALLSYWIERRWPAPNLPVYFVQVGLILPTVVLAGWYLCFDPSDRKNHTRWLVQPLFRAMGRN